MDAIITNNNKLILDVKNSAVPYLTYIDSPKVVSKLKVYTLVSLIVYMNILKTWFWETCNGVKTAFLSQTLLKCWKEFW